MAAPRHALFLLLLLLVPNVRVEGAGDGSVFALRQATGAVVVMDR
jgi:hypothetical protein